jgi:hypothetical protein
MTKLISAALLVAFVTPAAADFYIVQDGHTKKCTVVDKRPTVSTTTVVGDGTVYKTREEATTGMKTVKVSTEKETQSRLEGRVCEEAWRASVRPFRL